VLQIFDLVYHPVWNCNDVDFEWRTSSRPLSGFLGQVFGVYNLRWEIRVRLEASNRNLTVFTHLQRKEEFTKDNSSDCDIHSDELHAWSMPPIPASLERLYIHDVIFAFHSSSRARCNLHSGILNSLTAKFASSLNKTYTTYYRSRIKNDDIKYITEVIWLFCYRLEVTGRSHEDKLQHKVEPRIIRDQSADMRIAFDDIERDFNYTSMYRRDVQYNISSRVVIPNYINTFAFLYVGILFSVLSFSSFRFFYFLLYK